MTIVPKDLAPIVRAAKAAGWELCPGKRRPYLQAPDGRRVSLPTSSISPASLHNTLSKLRKAGITLR